jgi:flagellar protein FliL
MADNEEEQVEETQEQKKSPKKKKKSGSRLLIILIVILILVVIAGAVTAIFLFNGYSQAQNTELQNQSPQVAVSPETKKLDSEFGGDTPLKQIGMLYPLEPFTVNLSSSSGEHYVKLALSLELSNPNLALELHDKKAVLRDRIIRLLSSKTYESLSTIQGKNKLSREITDLLNTMLNDGTIEDVFFTEFVMQ